MWVQAAAAIQAERMRRALEARAVVAQVAEQKEAGRAAMAAAQVRSSFMPSASLSCLHHHLSVFCTCNLHELCLLCVVPVQLLQATTQ